jgi:15-cis-phytoene synthase
LEVFSEGHDMSEAMPSQLELEYVVSLRPAQACHEAQRDLSLDTETRQVMRQHAKSFNWAARFLAPSTRNDTQLLYAFARLADDLADEPELGALSHRLAALADLKKGLCNAVLAPSNKLTSAVARLREQHALPTALFDYFLDSLMADAHPRCLLTEQDLLTFAYGVAGTVGLMMRPLLGAPPEADAHALALGMAMQFTNMARDVVEDAEQGRTYIPASWGVNAAALRSPQGEAERFEAFMAIARLLAWAEAFYAFAEQGLGQIPEPNQRAIRIALSLYRGIGRKILRGGAGRYWQGRAHLSGFEKLCITAATLVHASRFAKVTAAAAAPEWDVPAALQSLRGLPGFRLI